MPRAKLPYIRNPVKQHGLRVPQLDLSEEDRWRPEVIERKQHYRSDRWRELRRHMLKDKGFRRCMFCGAWATTLEHLVGHGEDALRVAGLFGLHVDPDWRARFWTGPFCGACDVCARQRTGTETAGRLYRWTERWLEGKKSA